MTERTAAHMIADEAARWVARLDRYGDNAALRAEMQAWADVDARRAGALLRAEAAWYMLDCAGVPGQVQDDGRQDDSGQDRGSDPAQADASGGTAHLLSPDQALDAHEEDGGYDGEAVARLPVRRRMILWGGGLAAALMLAVTPWIFGDQSQQIETAMGEIRRVPLADGSFAAVNTDTKVEVALSAEQRHVVMARGEAWFQVAKDPERPFLVEAGDVRVQAVGTAFSVQMHDGNVDVRVTEGVVEIWRLGDEGNKWRVAAGALVSVGDQGKPELAASAEAFDRALSWRDGQLVFDGDTIGDAAEQFNRYNAIKIEIMDEKIAKSKMIGRFRTNEPQAFARAAATLLDAKVDVKENQIILSSH